MKSQKLKYTSYLFTYLLLFFSIFTMLEWFFHKQILFTINENGATTKFNTALLFFLCTISLIISRKKQRKYRTPFFIFTYTVLFISILTLIEYIFRVNLYVDNLFIKDTFTIVNPGRMSEATAVCFIFFAIGLTGLKSTNRAYIATTQHIALVTSIISLITILYFILRFPIDSKIVFFKTMSIQTAISFLFISFLLISKSYNIGFKETILGNSDGSRSLQKLLPFIILIPFFLSFFMLTLINEKIIGAQSGIIVYTLVLILSGFLYTYIVSIGLNKSDYLRRTLEKNLINKNSELLNFKEALDKIAIVAITDENTFIKYVNDKFCEISKYSREEIIGNTNEIVRSDYHPDSFYTEAWLTVSSGEPWFGEVKNRAKDGSLYWTETAIVPLKKRTNYIREYMAIQLDITKRKEAEELLASKYVKTLEQKNQELEQFNYITSHDLQEPLRTISSFSDILYEEYHDKLDSNAKQLFLFIKKATRRMSSLIKNLLDYSQLGRQREISKVNCNLLVNDIIEDLNSTIKQNKATIKQSNLPIINAYPIELRLLFQNLISNAIKFSKKDVSPQISIKAKKKDHVWEFYVKDNGIGIPEQFQKKIFSIFQRLHTENEYEGTGIGLAHCQKIVGMHGGEIGVKSKPGKGSTFFFTIPNQ
ncbi:PAS domain S-box protein [Tenacibaculum singaporense]|uniref:histidine kinase n=2 Tax=Tenacibaculum singaporense TaxID=2358479 RepID=A0A3S8R5U0_9FLAO|nr:PAS domain S-box protein [Tenacibaculum singaporense]